MCSSTRSTPSRVGVAVAAPRRQLLASTSEPPRKWTHEHDSVPDVRFRTLRPLVTSVSSTRHGRSRNGLRTPDQAVLCVTRPWNTSSRAGRREIRRGAPVPRPLNAHCARRRGTALLQAAGTHGFRRSSGPGPCSADRPGRRQPVRQRPGRCRPEPATRRRGRRSRRGRARLKGGSRSTPGRQSTRSRKRRVSAVEVLR